jgi:anti-sigma factor RsiW
MKHDLQLKVQAWLDGELSDKEARQIGEWVARDAEASALAAELGSIRQSMKGNEVAVAVEDSREFYWSKIQRQIEREGAVRPTDGVPWISSLRRWLVPIAGVGVLACALMMAVNQSAPTFDEISATDSGMEAVTFHDQASQMTVVWLQDSTPEAEQAPVAQKAAHYEDESDSVIIE